MIIKWFRKLKFYFKPPKKGEKYLANPSSFIIHKPIEHVLHSLTNKNGDSILLPIPSDDCHKLTIEIAAMPTYYVCKSEVFCRGVGESDSPDNKMGKWMERNQVKRVSKVLFRDMVVHGLLRKST
jgi:hypothetical protein